MVLDNSFLFYKHNLNGYLVFLDQSSISLSQKTNKQNSQRRHSSDVESHVTVVVCCETKFEASGKLVREVRKWREDVLFLMVKSIFLKTWSEFLRFPSTSVVYMCRIYRIGKRKLHWIWCPYDLSLLLDLIELIMYPLLLIFVKMMMRTRTKSMWMKNERIFI